MADNAYYQFKEDTQLMKGMGVNAYRFSISWSRILPTGMGEQPNQSGIDHYNQVIDDLIANDIIPMVTLFHWDTPLGLEELGGWLNPAMETCKRERETDREKKELPVYII